MKITLGSLFDGIGGFPLAASRYGIKTLWASEIEPFPIKVTKIRLPNMKHLGDITQINGAEIEPVDIITFGSPCQDLSVAGKRAGLAGERSGLFMEAVRIIKEMRNTYAGTNEPIRPRFAVWENVPGAFSSNKGEDFRAVLEETARIADETVIIPGPPKGKWNTVGVIMGNGYSIAWRVLDAQFWGVPQRRRRIFLVADFGGQSAPEILFKRKGLSRHIAKGREAGQGIATDAERGVRETSDCLTPWDVQSRRIHKASGKWPALYGGEGGGHGYAVIPEKLEPITVDFGRTADRITINPKVSVTLQGEGGGCGAKTGLYCIQGSMIGRADKNGPQGNGINEDVSFTLNTTDRHAVATKVYGICSYASNSMKSDNPHSGIYEAETSRTIDLNGGSPACNQGGMAIVQVLNDQGGSQMDVSENVVGTLRAEMHGNIPAVATYQKVTGPLMANSHPGSYTGQDAYTDMLVTPVYALDRASFNQGENAQYDFQISGDGKTQTVISRGPSAVAEPPRYSVRRLTPLECERLQGFPDGWTDIPGQEQATKEEIEWWREVWLTWDKTQAEDPEKVKPRTDNRLLRWLKNPVSDSAQYKALGNSVAVPCPEYVIEGISEVLSTER